MHQLRFIGVSCAIVAAALFTGCLAEDPGEEPAPAPGSSEQEIINGTSVDAANSGVVIAGGGCTGTLLTNNWVLTAKHCGTAIGTWIQMGPQWGQVDRVVDHPSLDVSVAHMSSALTMFGASNDNRVPLRRDALPVGAWVQCYGYGRNTFDSGFDGTLRTASLQVGSVAGVNYTFYPNSAGQIQWKGDSGGPCFDSSGQAIYVQSSCTYRGTKVTSCAGPRSDQFAAWADDIIYGYFGSAYKAHDWHCLAGEDCYLADVNGDRYADLVTFTKGGPVWVSLSNGIAFREATEWSGYFCVGDEICRVADVDADGRADLIAFNRAAGDVWVAISSGGGFYPASQWHDYFCVGDEVCEVGDVDGDHRADVIAFSRGTSGDVWVATSDGSRFNGSGWRWHDYFCANDEICKVGDVTGDGRADLIAFNRALGDVWVSAAETGQFGYVRFWSDYFCVGTETCEVADVDGDQHADLVAFTKGGAADVWVQLSAGPWAFGGPRKWHDYFCANDELCRLGDMNGDGRADVMAASHDTAYGDIWIAQSLTD